MTLALLLRTSGVGVPPLLVPPVLVSCQSWSASSLVLARPWRWAVCLCDYRLISSLVCGGDKRQVLFGGTWCARKAELNKIKSVVCEIIHQHRVSFPSPGKSHTECPFLLCRWPHRCTCNLSLALGSCSSSARVVVPQPPRCMFQGTPTLLGSCLGTAGRSASQRSVR